MESKHDDKEGEKDKAPLPVVEQRTEPKTRQLKGYKTESFKTTRERYHRTFIGRYKYETRTKVADPCSYMWLLIKALQELDKCQNRHHSPIRNRAKRCKSGITHI